MNKASPVCRGLAVAGLLGTMLLLGACATGDTVAPTGQLATARAAISEAESAGALNAAPVELLAAREKLGKAEAAAREERYTAARLLAEQSEADAVLAERRTRAAKARNAAEELARSNDVLRSEAERKSRP